MPPRVSVAFPLYRSLRWVPNIIANIANLDRSDVEIIISDRHCVDGAVAELEQQLRSDTRVRFIRATDALSWVAHYNLLLACATGKYFLWMPHDDQYPHGYLTGLIDALEADASAVLAFGSMICERASGVPMRPRQLRLPNTRAGAWSPRHAGYLFARGNHPGVAFRGLLRRDRVVKVGLYIRPTTGLVMADEYWLLALALLGPFSFAPVYCIKHFYPGSAHSGWRYSLKTRLEGPRVVNAYLRDYCRLPRDRLVVMAYFLWWTLRRLLDPLRT